MAATVRLATLVLMVAGGFAVIALTGPLSVQRFRGWSPDGPLGPLVFVLVSAVLSVLFVPGPLLAGAAGLLFGTALGTPVSVASATLGAVLAAGLSRGFAARPVDELGGRRVLAARDWATRRGFTGVLLLRLTPGVPFALVNHGIGVTRVPLAVLAAGTALGAVPRAFAYTALGGQFGSFDSWQTVLALSVLVVMGVGGIMVAARDPELVSVLARRR